MLDRLLLKIACEYRMKNGEIQQYRNTLNKRVINCRTINCGVRKFDKSSISANSFSANISQKNAISFVVSKQIAFIQFFLQMFA